jgi:hypothetical protein
MCWSSVDGASTVQYRVQTTQEHSHTPPPRGGAQASVCTWPDAVPSDIVGEVNQVPTEAVGPLGGCGCSCVC